MHKELEYLLQVEQMQKPWVQKETFIIKDFKMEIFIFKLLLTYTSISYFWQPATSDKRWEMNNPLVIGSPFTRNMRAMTRNNK